MSVVLESSVKSSLGSTSHKGDAWLSD